MVKRAAFLNSGISLRSLFVFQISLNEVGQYQYITEYMKVCFE
jgi:hypothetical protein